MSVKSKIDFAVAFEVKNANPNGDPLNGNRPRTTFEGFGELSDVCLKRKMRDRLQEAGALIFVQSDDRRTDECGSLRERAEQAGLLKLGERKEQIAFACSRWFDVRAFGQLFPFKKKGKQNKKDEDESNTGGDDSVSIGIRGPVSIHSAFSVSEVNVTSTQITKSVNSEGASGTKSTDTMGFKHRVDHGIYVFYGSINPQLAKATGFSDEDAAMIKGVLPRLFENDASSARPEGSMRVLHVFWWDHGCASGKYSSAHVHSSLKVSDDAKRPFELSKLDGLEPEVIRGF